MSLGRRHNQHGRESEEGKFYRAAQWFDCATAAMPTAHAQVVWAWGWVTVFETEPLLKYLRRACHQHVGVHEAVQIRVYSLHGTHNRLRDACSVAASLMSNTTYCGSTAVGEVQQKQR